jgi:hypothetical protein
LINRPATTGWTNSPPGEQGLMQDLRSIAPRPRGGRIVHPGSRG